MTKLRADQARALANLLDAMQALHVAGLTITQPDLYEGLNRRVPVKHLTVEVYSMASSHLPCPTVELTVPHLGGPGSIE